MTDWRDRVDQLLYDGERVTESVDVGAGRVVVTTHRVLAFTPEGDGANFRTADRPNVEGARVGTDGNRRYLRWALRPLLLGALLLAAGSQLSVGDPLSGVDTSGGGAAGTGGIVSTVAGITSLLSMLDELMLAVGAVCMLLVALLLGVYLLGRERLLVVSVAGGDDVELPVEGDRTGTASRLEAALARDDGAGSDLDGADVAGEATDPPTDDGGATTVDDVLSRAAADQSVEDPDPAGPLDTDPAAPPSDDVATPDGTDAGDGEK